MNRDEFAREMREIEATFGTDIYERRERHVAGDDLMCELLKKIGYTEGVEIFEKWDKSYS